MSRINTRGTLFLRGPLFGVPSDWALICLDPKKLSRQQKLGRRVFRLSLLSICAPLAARRTSNCGRKPFKGMRKAAASNWKWYMESTREREESNIVHKHRRWRGIWAVALGNWAFNVTTAKNLKIHSFRLYLSPSSCPRAAIDLFSAHFFFISCISRPIPASEKLFFIRFNYLQRRFLLFLPFPSSKTTATCYKAFFT